MGECQQQKHTQHALSTKMECDYLVGLKNGHICKNLTQNDESQRHSWGTKKKKKKKKKKMHKQNDNLRMIL